MDLPCGGQVLLVGDGDFSFTLSLMKKLIFRESQVITSNLETLDSIQQHKLAADNMQALTEIGVQVFLETDARELHTHPVISQARFQRIIFNFPLADRHKIKSNRALLVDFFASCTPILSDDGQVMVTLCRGQGGTPADQPMRSWHDSWQVQAMASNAGFILRDIMPFEASNYPEYHSVGFRFQDKSFNTDGALTHVFEKGDVAGCNEAWARGVVESGGSCFSCSHYLATRINRNLLQEINNPLCLLRQRLEVSFSLGLAAEIIPEEPNWRILPGHRSRISLLSNTLTTEGMAETTLTSTLNGDTHDDCGDGVKSDKERKNEQNLMTVKRNIAASLQHGVGRGDTCHGRSLQFQNEKHHISKFIPKNSESVFILIKKSEDSAGAATSCEDIGDKKSINSATLLKDDEVNDNSGGDCFALKESVESCPCTELTRNEVNSDSLGVLQTEHVANDGAEVADQIIPDYVGRVFHCRTSLLENLNDICGLVCGNDGLGQENFTKNLSGSEVSACSSSFQTGNSELISLDSEQVGAESQGSFDEVELVKNYGLSAKSFGGQCFVVSGQCFLPGSIEPDCLAARHEMIVVQAVPGSSRSFLTQETTNLPPSSQIKNPNNVSLSAASHFHGNRARPAHGTTNTEYQNEITQFQNYVSKQLLKCLHKSELFMQTSISVQDIGNSSEIVQLDGFQNVSNIKVIYMETPPMPEHATKQPTQTKGSKLVAGFMFRATSSQQMFVAILCLDNIVCQICGIGDPRLLWSQSVRFTEQFQACSFPQRFTPFSLFPLRFSHDLSFWQTQSDFDVGEMCTIIQNIAGDLVCKLDLIDLYTDPNSGQHSRCYRLHFQSHDQVLPYLISWKLQSLIRMETSRKLGVTLR